jgi:hypothetical protein
MKLKLSLVAALAVVVGLAIAAGLAKPSAHAASPATGSLVVPVNDPATGAVGTFTVSSFKVVDGVLTAVGTFTGTINGVPQTDTGTSQVTGGTGSCRILDLTLGPLHLDLLGLVIHLNQVHLTINAQQGPGNLLGNLLCAVANLLNGNTTPTALQQIANLLNQILARL